MCTSLEISSKNSEQLQSQSRTLRSIDGAMLYCPSPYKSSLKRGARFSGVDLKRWGALYSMAWTPFNAFFG